MQRRCWCLAWTWALGGWLVGCEPPSHHFPRDPADLGSEPQRSLEWLTVAGAADGDRNRECEEARNMIVGEADCSSTSCGHAVRLAKDWAALCRARTRGSLFAQVERLSIEYERRAQQPAEPCVQQLEAWLVGGCGSPGQCEAAVHAWTAHCGYSTATPLQALLWQKTVEQRSAGPRRQALDRRNCADLSRELLAASSCDKQYLCQDSLPKVERYRRRCPGDETTTELPEAVAELAIRHGAALPPRPLPLAAGSAQPAPRLPLALATGTGAALRVCGRRVHQLEDYLEQRRACVGGEVVFAVAWAEGERKTLRIATFEQPSDAVFARRFPSLWVVGERELRERRLLAGFAGNLGPIAEARPGPVSFDGLRRALDALDARLVSRAVMHAMAEWDLRFEPHLAELGRKKRAAPLGRLVPRDRWGFEARAWDLPFADLGADATVSVGEAGPAADLRLDDLLPRSVAAYRAEVVALARHVESAPFSPQSERWWTHELEQRTVACKAAADAVQSAERDLTACGVGPEHCSPAARRELGSVLDRAQRMLERAYTLTVVSLYSLPLAKRDTLRASTLGEGACPIP